MPRHGPAPGRRPASAACRGTSCTLPSASCSRTDRGPTSRRARHHAGTAAEESASTSRRCDAGVDDRQRASAAGSGGSSATTRPSSGPIGSGASGAVAHTHHDQSSGRRVRTASVDARCVPRAPRTAARATGSARARGPTTARDPPGSHGWSSTTGSVVLDEARAVAATRAARSRTDASSRGRRRSRHRRDDGGAEDDERHGQTREEEDGLAQRDGERDRTDERGQPRREPGREAGLRGRTLGCRVDGGTPQRERRRAEPERTARSPAPPAHLAADSHTHPVPALLDPHARQRGIVHGQSDGPSSRPHRRSGVRPQAPQRSRRCPALRRRRRASRPGRRARRPSGAPARRAGHTRRPGAVGRPHGARRARRRRRPHGRRCSPSPRSRSRVRARGAAPTGWYRRPPRRRSGRVRGRGTGQGGAA